MKKTDNLSLKKFTRGSVTIHEQPGGIVTFTIGNDLDCPETEFIGSLHKDYLQEMGAVIRLLQGSEK